MLRPLTLLPLAALTLTSCDKLIKAAMEDEESGSLESQIQITSDSKPEIITAFDEISSATRAHNRVLLERMESNQPANGPAYSAGINHLDKAGKKHGGLAKQIIDAVASARIYEKDMFVVFDTMHKQAAGMETWGGSDATRRRAYVQIVDSGIRAYDRAIVHLQRGEEPLLRQKFDKQKVPREVSDEFLRLRRIWGAKIRKPQKEMFQEQRAALQSYRSAFGQTNPAKFNAHIAEAKKHEQNGNRAKQQMVAEIRKSLGSSNLL